MIGFDPFRAAEDIARAWLTAWTALAHLPIAIAYETRPTRRRPKPKRDERYLELD